jgi:glycosyltransferase involved in cell wall biosynthesis
MTSDRPKISVVTPVFNGERYLVEAIESVRAQTCTDWEYVIADNCSTDRTLEIARRYAALDPRIRVFEATEFLPIIANWNRALRQIAPDAKYCKVLHADDRLFPECLERMSAVMDQNDNVGIVGAYVLADRVIQCDGLPYGRNVWDGHEICRNTLLGRYYLFGSPTSLLLRADLIRARPEGFYNESNLHADFEICYALLESCDFGFIHQVLTFTRTHAASMGNTFSRVYNPQLVEYLGMMRKYGPKYLDEQTFDRAHSDMVRTYRRLIARRLISGRGREYWKFHRDKLRALGYSIGPADIARGAVEEFARLLTRPREAGFLLAGLASRTLLEREHTQPR